MVKQKKKQVVTLVQWLIQNINGDSYRSGKLTGWKHPNVNQELIDAVGGMSNLLKQIRELEQDWELGKAEKFRADWRYMGNDVEKLHYSVSIMPLLCKREGIQDPREHQQNLIERVMFWKERENKNSWIVPYYDEILRKLQKGKVVSEAEEEGLFQALHAVVKQKEFIWERVFSVRIFQDSKLFAEKYKQSISTILKKYSPYYLEEMSNDELFAMHDIHSYAQTLEWKGPLQYQIDHKYFIDTTEQKYGIVLNSQTMEHSMPLALPGCKTIMTIENKANYESMIYTDDTLYIFCHGYFTPKEVRFLKEVEKIAASQCTFYHWGDLDFGGIRIFQFIKEKVFPALVPYKMDTTDFQKALELGGGITLSDSTREKLEAKDAGILTPLKNIILETNMTIEQERLL